MNIKDYLHLYLGCEVQVQSESEKGKIKILACVEPVSNKAWTESGNTHYIDLIKPILRPLSDMTEEEKREADLVRGNGDGCDNYAVPEAYEFKYLLSKHFDLFGLIEAGLAIDKTTIK